MVAITLRGDHKDFAVPVHQADATLTQAPVSGIKYVVLDTKNARIISIGVKCVWTVQPTPLEIHITIDGVAIIASKIDPVTNTEYLVNDSHPLLATLFLESPGSGRILPFLIEGRSVKIEAEITGGTVSNLTARVKYAKW